MARYLLLIFSFLLMGSVLVAQTSIQGKVTDKETGEPIIFGNVALYKNSVLITGIETDFDGNYSITSIDPGNYDVEVTYIGYPTQRIAGVVAAAGKANKLDIQLTSEGGVDLTEVVVTDYKVPLIEQDNTTQGKTITSEDIRNLPTKSINAIAGTAAGIASADEGGALNIKGSRSNATDYYIDGVRVSGNLVPQQDIEQLQVITGGIEARYGDVTGGIISITTKGPSAKFSGGFELETSQLFDEYDYNLAALNVSGPLLKKSTGESIIGFRLSGQYRTVKDGSPSALPLYRVKDDKLKELQANPVMQIGNSFFPAIENITNEDVNKIKFNPFRDNTTINLTGKLEARLSKNIDISFSGTYAQTDNTFSPGATWVTFNSHNNPTNHSTRYRGIFRLRHRLGGAPVSTDDSEENKAKKGALIQNASYTLQVGYERAFSDVGDKRHGDNLFNYGYIGNYDLSWDPTLTTNQEVIGDSILFYTGMTDYTRTFNGYTVNTDINPVLTNYIVNGEDIESFDAFEVRNGSLPGTLTNGWSGLHSNVGLVYNSWSKSESDVLTVNANTSFELLPGGSEKGRHNIQLGILFEQRESRGYSVAPSGLWGLARLLANEHIEGQGLDSSQIIGTETGFLQIFDTYFNPIFTDTMHQVPIFAPNVEQNINADNQFYINIRKINGEALNEYINVDGLSPDQMSLNMFSARELNDFGFVGYTGYDYLGNKLEDVTFEEFFSATDANGIRTFPVAPNRPNYLAAFIQDKFTFKDIIFRLGVRVDRYDANTKVLKDPYSLYDVMTAGDFHNQFGGAAPGTVKDDFKVYTNTEGGEGVRAYRNGDTWFLPNGTQVNDGSEIFGGEIVFPRYAESDSQKRDIQSIGFDPDVSFRDYEPKFNWMPRLSFSFPISDEANFFAHYDVLVQRPPSNSFVSPRSYFYFEESTGIRNNPNLQPERTIDYEVGFQQKLSNSSALKLAAYYKELRDMIQSRFIAFVPAPVNQYETYDNLDFATVKGFTVQYDLRRTNNVQMNIAYTLQFADGTGSNANSSRGLTSRGIQRTLNPMGFDERHRLSIILDYRYRSGKQYNGPRIGGNDIFANTGINVNAVAVSGRPYTAGQIPTRLGASGFEGSINGSRLPWNFTVNMQIDKSFKLTKPDAARRLNLNVYFRVSNLLDRRNILGVYRFTGSPTDDGFLQFFGGSEAVQQLEEDGRNVQSFLDSYSWRVANGRNYTLPRRMYLGAVFGF